MDSREYIVPEDVQALAPFVTVHRLMMSGASDRTAHDVIDNALRSTQVPA
jgi:hypothetical protein